MKKNKLYLLSMMAILTITSTQFMSCSKDKGNTPDASTPATSTPTTSTPVASTPATSTPAASTSAAESTSSNSSTIVEEVEVITNVSITNKDELTASWLDTESQRTVKITVEGTKRSLEEMLADETVKITSSDATVVEVQGVNLVVKKAGTATITVAVGELKDTVDVVITKVYYAPILALSSEADMNCSQNGEITLPTVSATVDGEAIESKYITITDNLDNASINLETNKFKSSVVGVHELTVKAVNPNDPEKITTKVVKVNVFRRLFLSSNSNNVQQWVGSPNEVEKQWLKLTDKGNNVDIFNMQASDTYYAEARFQGFTTVESGADYLGMAHFSDFGSIPGIASSATRWLASAVQLTTGMPTAVNGRTGEKTTVNVVADVQGWSNVNVGNTNGGVYYERASVQNPANGIAGANSQDTTFTYAIARVGDLFYSFVNGKLDSVYSDMYYASKNTIPGLWARLHTQSGAEGDAWTGKKVDNINYYDGEKATSKVDELLVSSTRIAPWGAGFCDDSIQTGAIVVGEQTAEKGINFTCTTTTGWTNNNTATLRTALATNFKLEYVYKKTDGTGHIYVDLRNNLGADTVLNAGMDSNNLILDAGNNWGTVVGAIGTDTMDMSQGIKVTIVRKIDTTAQSSTYTVSYTSVANPTQVISKEIVDTKYWNTAVLPVFKNRGLSGEWTNIVFEPTK